MLKLSLITHTPEPDKIVAGAAKLCYSPVGIYDILEDLTQDKVDKFLAMLMDMGHESPMEHVSFTFGVEDISRVSEIQLVRHRIGCSYSIQSGRYVRRDGAEFIIPPAIQANEEALRVFLNALDVCQSAYGQIADILTAQYVQEGMRPSQAEKKAVEDARYIQPQGLGTKLVFTMNARAILNFLNHRCCNRAQWEIRELAYQMVMELRKIAPVLFKNAGPACLNGPCPEGAMSCGKMLEMREKYHG